MPTYKISDVKPIHFNAFIVQEDGEGVVFEVADRKGAKGHVAISWTDLGHTLQMLVRGGEAAEARRKMLGKQDFFTGAGDLHPPIVEAFQISEAVKAKVKLLHLFSRGGMRSDFAIPLDAVGQDGRLLLRAMSDDLVADLEAEYKRPN